MKLYIVGGVASGKSTLARRLAAQTGIPCHALDEVVHVADSNSPGGNRRRTDAERDALFNSIIDGSDWIIEDTGRACFMRGMECADAVVLLDIPPLTRRARIVRRFIKQRTGREACSYKPTFSMLRSMFRWARNYETGADGTRDRVRTHARCFILLTSEREISDFCAAISRGEDISNM